MRYSLSDGGVIDAGVKLGEGGEGVVYEALDGQRAIKLYHKPLAGRAADKLRAMVSLETLGLGSQAAWPQALITGPDGAIAGFVMQKAAEPFDIHTVYSPRDRREKLPRADWRFLVHVAANLAAAFHAAHEAGVVIGDVNHGSVRVGKDGCVRLIDCDSYQITQNGRTLRCGVGVDAYTPPELQGVSLADVDRTSDHDAFGLAVLIFQLLFMGRHPFAGAPRVSGAPTAIPAAIVAHAYAYAAKSALLRPPPSAPPIDLVSPDLVLLFEQAFKGKGPRPSPLAWHQALTAFALTLVTCSASPRHQMPSHLKSCPWCAFDTVGVEFFPAAMTAGAALDLNRFDPSAFEAVWNRIETAQARIRAVAAQACPHATIPSGLPPGVQQDLSVAIKAGPPPPRSARMTGWLRRGLAIATGFIALGLVAFVSLDMAAMAIAAGLAVQLLSGTSREVVDKAREELRRVCNLRWQDLQAVIDQVDGDDVVARHKKEGRNLIRQIRSLQTQLSNAPREVQLKAFLEKFPLQKDSASGIGQSRITQLASFGIESAGDIDRDAIMQVPGFGPQLADRLCTWRDDLKKRFRFNPASPMRPADMRRFERDLKKPLEHFQNELKKSARQAQIQERRLATVTARLSAHDCAIATAVAAAAAAEVNHRAGRLLPALAA
ncbi:MAG: hypothetical protein EON93_01230 [Burkholderiales bacterium]|nr:MAG: hypothetical protein EON93_01230 [Burkholderiales bacterium]